MTHRESVLLVQPLEPSQVDELKSSLGAQLPACYLPRLLVSRTHVLLEVCCTMLMRVSSTHSIAPGNNAGGVLKKGEKLFLEQKVDPSLIGGFVIDIGALQSAHEFVCRRKCFQSFHLPLMQAM
jgi:hypothetical protein